MLTIHNIFLKNSKYNHRLKGKTRARKLLKENMEQYLIDLKVKENISTEHQKH